MNIFWLDEDMARCAEYHCDKHVVKMLLESVQILNTVLYKAYYDRVVETKPQDSFFEELCTFGYMARLGRKRNSLPYKPTHPNHPCVAWAGECTGNFKKLTLLATKLSNEYTYRYGRRHKSADALRSILELTNMNRELPLPDHLESRPPQCVGEGLFDPSADVVDVYREYYKQKELDGMDMRWTGRSRPEFMR